MKKIITTLGFLTFIICAIGQAPVQIVTDPKLLEQAFEQAVKEAERLALQEAQKELQQLQADAMSKVSSALKNIQILKVIFASNVEMQKDIKKANREISEYKISNNSKQIARKKLLKVSDRSKELAKRADAVMQDDVFKGTDAQRLLLLTEIEREQMMLESGLFSIKVMFRNM